MSNANTATPQIYASVDKAFAEYMHFAATASTEDIQNSMKRNLNGIRQYNAKNHEMILHCYNTYAYWGKLDPENGEYELIENRARALKEHHTDLVWLYDRLCDYRSKQTLFGIVENWLTFSMLSLDRIIERIFRQYFDLDVFRCGADEVLVDVGAYTGDSVRDYIGSYGEYKRIYCYEIVPQTFSRLEKNLENHTNIIYRQRGAGDQSGTMFISQAEPDQSMHKLSGSGADEISVVTIDEDITEPVTFIKMDIEGGEQKAILGCRRHIQAEHPKLAISVYHNNEDIWKCARIIEDIDPGYRFYLRYYGGNYYPSECVLLGV